MSNQKMKLYAGGTLSPHEHYYIERPEDRMLYKLCRRKEYCYILAARQMGKSSLAANAIINLEKENIRCIYVDLQGIGKQLSERDIAINQPSEREIALKKDLNIKQQSLNPELEINGNEVLARKAWNITSYQNKWYLSLLNEVLRGCKEFHNDLNLDEWWASKPGLDNIQKMISFFNEILLARIHQQIVVFIDEIDRFPENILSDDFFMALRKMHNDRFNNDGFKRLSFVIIGHRLPRSLIQDKGISPFNIGERLDVGDFQIDKAINLTNNIKLGPEISPQQVIEAIFSYTNGHPYMTHEACKYLADITCDNNEDEDEDLFFLNNEEQISEIMEYLIKKKFAEKHLTKIQDWLDSMPDQINILRLYGLILEGNHYLFDETIQPMDDLRYSGLIKTEKSGTVCVRNKIYATVFNKEWVIRELKNKHAASSPSDFSFGLGRLGLQKLAEKTDFRPNSLPIPNKKEEELINDLESNNANRTKTLALQDVKPNQDIPPWIVDKAAGENQRIQDSNLNQGSSSQNAEKVTDERSSMFLDLEEEKVEIEQSPLNDWLTRRVEKKSLSEQIALNLARADLKLKVAEYFALIIIATFSSSMIVGFFGNWNTTLVFVGAVIGFLAPPFYVKRMQIQHFRLFEDQLIPALNLIVNGLRAGYSTMQAIESVSRELPSPISDEFRRVVTEMQIGIPMETALNNLLRRIPSKELDTVVTAINLQREVGGNLSEILNVISFRAMDRQRVLLQSKRVVRPSLLFFIGASGAALTLHSVIYPNSFKSLENHSGMQALLFSIISLWIIILVLAFILQMKKSSLLNEL